MTPTVPPETAPRRTLATTVLTAKPGSDPERAGGAGRPTRSMLFLHGLLGTRANWRGLARKFVDARPDWAAVLVDLREHGESLDLPGDDTVDQCARDLEMLEALVTEAPIRGALGHSFGGKVAMRWAERRREPVDELWIIDSTPSRRDVSSGEAGRVLALLEHAVALNPEGFADREAFTSFVVGAGESRGIADWLAMNLVTLPNGRRGLRLDLERLARLLRSYGETDTWRAIESSDSIAAVRFLVGGRSEVVDEADRRRIASIRASGRNVELVSFPDAGHWVHVDAPGPLIERLTLLY